MLHDKKIFLSLVVIFKNLALNKILHDLRKHSIIDRKIEIFNNTSIRKYIYVCITALLYVHIHTHTYGVLTARSYLLSFQAPKGKLRK